MKNQEHNSPFAAPGYLERRLHALLVLILVMLLSLHRLHVTDYVSNANRKWNTATIGIPNAVMGSLGGHKEYTQKLIVK